MSQIAIEVYTLEGVSQLYHIDLGMHISDLIVHIVKTHAALGDLYVGTIDWARTRLIYNNKTLEPTKTLEQYTEFQFKAKGPYKMHIMPKGGEPPKGQTAQKEREVETQRSSPISIRSCVPRNRNMAYVSKSYPGANSFLDNQINLLDQKHKTETLRQLSTSITEITECLKQSNSEDRLEQIFVMLQTIDHKLTLLINASPTII